MQLRFKLVLILLLVSTLGFGQSYSKDWRFGQLGRVEFTPGGAIGQSGSILTSFEGCVAITDPTSGNILFYSNGEQVWGANNANLQNGTALTGKQTTTQSTLVVPYPGQVSRYILFTLTNTLDSAGLQYSVIDMTLNGGLGGVVAGQKNLSVIFGFPTNALSEKLTATKHCNGTDYWVMGHFVNSAQFFRFLVTPAGVQPISLQSIGSSHPFPNTANTGSNKGYMKFSPDGCRLALVTNQQNGSLIELFRFDKSTGLLSDPRVLPATGGEYGVSFSPDNAKLYITAARDSLQSGQNRPYNTIWSFDLLADNPATTKTLVKARRETVDRSKFGALQNGPDGRIYVAQEFRDGLNAIVTPNGFGATANYTDSVLQMPSATTRQGLPNFIDDEFSLPFRANFTNDFVCIGNPMQFRDSSLSNAISWSWDFDLANAGTSTSNIRNPIHTYPAPGTYNVKLVVERGCGVIDSIIKPVTIGVNLPVNLGADSVFICLNDTAFLGSNLGQGSYQWYTGSPGAWVPSPNDTLPDLAVSTTGWYRLTVNNGSCDGQDSVYVLVNTSPVDVDLGPDQLLCIGSSIELDAENPGAVYLWSTGETTRTITVTAPDTFYVTATFQGCVDTDTIIVFLDSITTVNVMNDTFMCPEVQPLVINAAAFGTSFLWSTGETTPSITVTDTGTYAVQITTAAGCTVYDTIPVRRLCPTKVDVPSAFTPNKDGLNDIFQPAMTSVDQGYEFIIYNRWGQQVFYTIDVNAGWDGTFNGVNVEEGYYQYVVRYFTNVERVFTYKSGQVYLFR